MRLLVPVFALATCCAGVAFAAGGSGGPPAEAARAHSLTPLQQRLLSGTAKDALQASAVARLRAPALTRTSETGCPANRGSNVRVNQECQNLTDPDLAGRGEAQNETAVSQNPNDASDLVAAANDYRRGDSGCYTYHSSDGGRSWQDSTPPASFTRGTNFSGLPRKYWQAGGDPTVAWDTRGNAYLTCLFFDRGGGVSQNPDASSAFYVFRSTQTGGASWNFPGRPVDEFSDPEGEGEVLLDKEYMAIDTSRSSRFRDRIYVSWTLFDDDGTSNIYLAYSSDYGETFSDPVLVSGDNPDLCTLTFELPGSCNTNQFSQPFTGPDGTVYVAFANYNTTGLGPRGEDDEGEGGDARVQAAPEDNRAQILLARSTNGGQSFSRPVKVADFYDLPDCETYQDGNGGGSSCVPEKGDTSNSFFRAANYPSGGVDPRDDDEVIVTFGSYINRHSRESNGCVPTGFNEDTFLPLYDGVKTPGACNNDIVVSRSTDGGRHFDGATTDVRKLPSARDDDPRADQWFQWADFDRNGRLAVSFYDRGYGNDERTGFSDYSLSGSRNGSDFATTRVTTASMPPPTEFAGAFFGDYSGLSADEAAHPVWSDTRDVELFACGPPPAICTMAGTNAAVQNDQNIYTRTLAVPLP